MMDKPYSSCPAIGLSWPEYPTRMKRVCGRGPSVASDRFTVKIVAILINYPTRLTRKPEIVNYCAKHTKDR